MKRNLFFSIMISLMVFNITPVFAQNFQTADLEGTWYLFDTTVDPAIPAVYWTYGEFEADASGKVLSGSYYTPDGSSFNIIDGQMLLDIKGVLSGAATIDMGEGNTATAIFPHGKLDQAKTNGAYVSLVTPDGTLDTSMGIGSFIKGGGTFTQVDLEGEWYGQGTMVDLTGGAVFTVSGKYNIDQFGNVTGGSFTAPNGTVATVTGGQVLVNAKGITSGSVALLMNGVPMISVFVQGKMDQSKRSLSYVSMEFDDTMTNLLFLSNVHGVKSGGEFTATDLSGNWYTYSLAMDYSDLDPNNWLIYWVRGQYRTDSSGNISSGYYVGPDGTVINATGGTLSLDNDGVIQGNITIEDGPATMNVNGKLDLGKTQGIFSSVDDTGFMNGMTTGLMIKDTYLYPWSMFLPAFIRNDK